MLGAALAAFSLGSNLVGALGANKAGKTAAKGFATGAEQAGQAIDQGYFDALKYLTPYAQFGEAQLPMLQQLSQQPQFSYGDFFNSQQYRDLASQAEDQALRNASATGELRGGGAQLALARIAPQLAMQERDYQNNMNQQRFGNVFNLAQFGSGFGQNAAQLAMNRGNALADYRYNAATGGANARAQGQQQMFGHLQRGINDIASIYGASKMGNLGGQQQSPGQQAAPIDMATYKAPTYFTDKYGG